MKKFLIKSAIIFIFSLLFFRFTFISLINHYENKLAENFSSDNVKIYKSKLIESLKKTSEKDKILYEEDAELLGVFLNKLIQELDLKINK